MSRVKDGNYIVIQSFMVKELGLKGNELMIYAIIYGFSQNGQKFSGSLQYLSDWLNCTKQAVMNNLKSLCKKGLIKKTDIEKSGVKFCEYNATYLNGGKENCIPGKENCIPGKESCMGGIQESLPNNLCNNISSNNIEDNIVNSKQKKCYGEYNNVLLTDEDIEKLKSKFPDWKARIEDLSCYMESKGKKYKNHRATIEHWARMESDKNGQNNGNDNQTDEECESRFAGIGIDL